MRKICVFHLFFVPLRRFLNWDCSMSHTNPQSGDSSGMTLEVPSEALLQVQNDQRLTKKKIIQIITDYSNYSFRKGIKKTQKNQS